MRSVFRLQRACERIAADAAALVQSPPLGIRPAAGCENVGRFGDVGGMVAHASRHRVRKWLYLVEMMKSRRLENLALLLIPPWTLEGIE
jgi:hypothetical protein